MRVSERLTNVRGNTIVDVQSREEAILLLELVSPARK
jgi:hypothetical protein